MPASVELKVAGSAALGIGVGYALARWRCAPAAAGTPAPPAAIGAAAANEPAAAEEEDFSARAVALLNDTATSVALGVASRTGLLDALLLAGEEAAGDDGAVLRLSAAELADLAARAAHEGEEEEGAEEGGAAATSGGGLCARYVEEILAVLVTGGVVRLANADGDVGDGGEEELRFWLPVAWRVALSSMGLYFEELPLLSQCAFAQVCDAAAAGGRGNGVAPSHYAAFGAWMGRLADEKHEAQLVQKLLPAISQAAAAMRGGGGGGSDSDSDESGGESGGGATAATLLERLSSGDARVLDLGCGSGAAARLLARAYPEATVVGVDVDATAIARARAAAAQEEAPLPNLAFEVVDAAQLAVADGGGGGGGSGSADWAGSFDLVTSFDAIHDLTDPAAALRGARALLKPGSGSGGGGGGGGSGGVFAMVDIRAGTGLRANVGHGFAPFLYCVSLLHCMPQGLNDGGAGLGMMWGRGRALAMLRDAGFGAVEVLEPNFDAFNDCFLCRA